MNDTKVSPLPLMASWPRDDSRDGQIASIYKAFQGYAQGSWTFHVAGIPFVACLMQVYCTRVTNVICGRWLPVYINLFFKLCASSKSFLFSPSSSRYSRLSNSTSTFFILSTRALRSF